MYNWKRYWNNASSKCRTSYSISSSYIRNAYSIHFNWKKFWNEEICAESEVDNWLTRTKHVKKENKLIIVCFSFMQAEIRSEIFGDEPLFDHLIISFWEHFLKMICSQVLNGQVEWIDLALKNPKQTISNVCVWFVFLFFWEIKEPGTSSFIFLEISIIVTENYRMNLDIWNQQTRVYVAIVIRIIPESGRVWERKRN